MLVSWAKAVLKPMDPNRGQLPIALGKLYHFSLPLSIGVGPGDEPVLFYGFGGYKILRQIGRRELFLNGLLVPKGSRHIIAGSSLFYRS